MKLTVFKMFTFPVIILLFPFIYVTAIHHAKQEMHNAGSIKDSLNTRQLHMFPLSFQPFDLTALNLHKANEALPTDSCGGSTLIHNTIVPCTGPKMMDVYAIPHSSIIHDGVRCGTGDSMDYTLIVSGERMMSAQDPTNELHSLHLLLEENIRAFYAFRVLQKINPVYVGLELTAPRVCAEKEVYPKGTVYFFLKTAEGKPDLNFGFAYLHAFEVGMISIKLDQHICMYKETRRLGPMQSPFATPTPKPSGYMMESYSTAGLLNPPLLPECFLAEVLQVTPIPEEQPSMEPDMDPVPPLEAMRTSVRLSQFLKPSGFPLVTPTRTPPPPHVSRQHSYDLTMNTDRSLLKDEVCFPSSSRLELESGLNIPIAEMKMGYNVFSYGREDSGRTIRTTSHTDNIFSSKISIPTLASFLQMNEASIRDLAREKGWAIENGFVVSS